jgi:hypothetical protein
MKKIYAIIFPIIISAFLITPVFAASQSIIADPSLAHSGTENSIIFHTTSAAAYQVIYLFDGSGNNVFGDAIIAPASGDVNWTSLGWTENLPIGNYTVNSMAAGGTGDYASYNTACGEGYSLAHCESYNGFPINSGYAENSLTILAATGGGPIINGSIPAVGTSDVAETSGPLWGTLLIILKYIFKIFGPYILIFMAIIAVIYLCVAMVKGKIKI